jgi:hypothetical protein
LEPLVSLVLFLCGDEADIAGQTDPPPDPANEGGQGVDPPGEAMADVFRWQVGRRPAPQQSQGLAGKKTARRGRKAGKAPKLTGSADHTAH